jgi:branched-chain amino acid transport system substrate-binding protein
MNKKIWAISSVVIVLVLVVIVVKLKVKEQDGNIVPIGVVLPLTGPSASHGKDAMGGLELAREEIESRRQPGQPRLELLIEDSLSSPQGGVSAIQKLIQTKKTSVVIGPVASSVMLAMIPIAEREKIVLFSPSASSPEISNTGDYIFRIALLAPPQAQALAEYAIDGLDVNRAAILYVNDDTGISYKQAFVESFSKLGGKVILEESYDKISTDFRLQLTKLKNAQPQIIFIPGVPRATGLILRQAKELGLDCHFLGNYGAEGADLITSGGDATEGFVYASLPISDKFTSLFKAKYNRVPTTGAPLVYDALHIISQIIADYGTSADAIKKGLSELKDYEGATGRMTLLPSGDADREICLKIVKNGKFEILR